MLTNWLKSGILLAASIIVWEKYIGAPEIKLVSDQITQVRLNPDVSLMLNPETGALNGNGWAINHGNIEVN
jgi:hypothetical protein